MTTTRHNARYVKLRRQVGKVNNNIREIAFIEDRNCCGIPLPQFEIAPNGSQSVIQKVCRIFAMRYDRVNLLIRHTCFRCHRNIAKITYARYAYTSWWNHCSFHAISATTSNVTHSIRNILTVLQIFWRDKWDLATPVLANRCQWCLPCYNLSKVTEFVFRPFHGNNL